MSKVHEIITEQFIKALDGGIIPWRMPWDQVEFNHANFKTKSEYSGVNVLLLMLAKYMNGFKSPYWMTFKQAKSMGANVRKGAKGSHVVFYKTWEKDTGKIDVSGKAVTDRIPVIRYYSVFNLDQIEGVEVPETAPRRTHSPIETAEAIVKGYQDAPRIDWTDETRAYYSTLADYINMPKKEYFHRKEEIYSTLFHELTHSTGHETRLNRFKDGATLNANREDYSKEELTAELGSAFLCNEAGIDGATIENQKAYIQGWSKALKQDPRMIAEAGSKAQKAVNYIRGKK